MQFFLVALQLFWKKIQWSVTTLILTITNFFCFFSVFLILSKVWISGFDLHPFFRYTNRLFLICSFWIYCQNRLIEHKNDLHIVLGSNIVTKNSCWTQDLSRSVFFVESYRFHSLKWLKEVLLVHFANKFNKKQSKTQIEFPATKMKRNVSKSKCGGVSTQTSQ